MRSAKKKRIDLKMTHFEAVVCYEFIKDKFDKHQELKNCTSVDIEKSYNGAGSDNTPDIIRRKLKKYTSFDKEAVAEHDLSWYLVEQGKITKDRKEFHASNMRLKNNMRKCAKMRYAWYNPYYSWCYAKGWLAEHFCNKYGWEAWSS